MKCASCQGVIRPGQGREIVIEQSTAVAPTIVVHARVEDCPVVARRMREN